MRRPDATGVLVGGAAAWSVLFGVASLYVAAGGRAGDGLVAPALVTAVRQREPEMLATLWITGVLKVSCGAAVILAHRFIGGFPRLLLGVACILLGAGLAAWGLAEGLAGGLVATGAVAPLEGWGDGQVGRYYALLWGPFWLTGGVLYVAAGRRLRRRPAAHAAKSPGALRVHEVSAAPGRHPPSRQDEPYRWWMARWHAR